MFEELINKINECDKITICYKTVNYSDLKENIKNYNETKHPIWLKNNNSSKFLDVKKIGFKDNGFIARNNNIYWFIKLEDIISISGKYTNRRYGEYTTDEKEFEVLFRNQSYNDLIKELVHLVKR